MTIAHAGHWAVSLLYVAPMAVIGGVLWWTARRERVAGDEWYDDTDPRVYDEA